MKKILVTGSHRSGTTWVGNILSENRNVTYIHEPFNLQINKNKFSLPLKYSFSYIPDLDDKEEFFTTYERILSLNSYPKYPKSYAWHFKLRCIFNDRVENFKNKCKSNTVLIKDSIALLSAEHLCRKFDMKVVCMIRNPLAFCGSIKQWNWKFSFSHFLSQPILLKERFSDYHLKIKEYAENECEIDVVDQGILLWNLFHEVILQYKKQHRDWIFLRHEDVVKNPIDVFSDTYKQLGLIYTDKIGKKIASSLSSKEGETKDPAYKARDKVKVLKTWMNRLSPTEIEKINKGTKDLRRHFYPSNE